MGLCNSRNIFQEKMSEIFVGLDTIRVYINDLLHVTKGSWAEHITVLKEKNSASRRLGSRSTPASHASSPTNLNTWVITSLVKVLCPYQIKSRPFNPSQYQRLENNLISSLVLSTPIVTCVKSALSFLPH